jgi:hypothetical protein
VRPQQNQFEPQDMMKFLKAVFTPEWWANASQEMASQ